MSLLRITDSFELAVAKMVLQKAREIGLQRDRVRAQLIASEVSKLFSKKGK